MVFVLVYYYLFSLLAFYKLFMYFLICLYRTFHSSIIHQNPLLNLKFQFLVACTLFLKCLLIAYIYLCSDEQNCFFLMRSDFSLITHKDFYLKRWVILDLLCYWEHRYTFDFSLKEKEDRISMWSWTLSVWEW